MRQCKPLEIAGRSRPKRALAASSPWPEAADGAALAGGSDCSAGPFGAGEVLGAGATLCAGGGAVFGTFAGGRRMVEGSKNCAETVCGKATRHRPTAKRCPIPPPALVDALPIQAFLDINRGKFKPARTAQPMFWNVLIATINNRLCRQDAGVLGAIEVVSRQCPKPLNFYALAAR